MRLPYIQLSESVTCSQWPRSGGYTAPRARAAVEFDGKYDGSRVALSWTAGAGGTPTHYTLMACVTPDGAPVQTVRLTGAAISFPDVPAGTYYLRLTASNAAGVSPPSAPVTLTVP